MSFEEQLMFQNKYTSIVSIILQIVLQRTGKLFTDTLLLAAWDVYFSVFSVVFLINKQTRPFFCNGNLLISYLEFYFKRTLSLY